jgi:hypothetical protein
MVSNIYGADHNWRVSLLEIPKPYFTASLVEEQNSENVFMSSLSHGGKC